MGVGKDWVSSFWWKFSTWLQQFLGRNAETTSLEMEQQRLEKKVRMAQLNGFQQPHHISFKGQLAEEKEPN